MKEARNELETEKTVHQSLIVSKGVSGHAGRMDVRRGKEELVMTLEVLDQSTKWVVPFSDSGDGCLNVFSVECLLDGRRR